MLKTDNRNLEINKQKKDIKFPPVEYIDIYSIKAMGKLRKFFIEHWIGETNSIQSIITFLFILFIILLIVFSINLNLNGIDEILKDKFGLVVLATPLIVIVILLV